MSSAEVEPMTESQKALLESLEEEFKDRYTDKDPYFREVMKKTIPPPPVVENWVRPHENRYSRQWNDRRDHRVQTTRTGPDHPTNNYNRYELYRGYRHDDDYDNRRSRHRSDLPYSRRY